MIKNTEVLKKLNIDEKISLITDGNSLIEQGNEKAGIAKIGSASWEDLNSSTGNMYPSFYSLVNCWNTDLISEVTADLTVRAKISGKNFVYTPAIRVKSNPYARGISEDPYFVSECALNTAKAIKSAGAAPCVTGVALGYSDIRYIDDDMDVRAMREYFFGPYRALSAISDGVAIQTDYIRLTGSYKEVNTEVLGNMLSSLAEKKNGFIVCASADEDAGVESAMKHTLCLNGNPTAIRQALLNYDKIKESMNMGDASGTDLDEAQREFTAVGESDIDERADKVIDFAEFCLGGTAATPPTTPERLALNAATESIVLLKNANNVLPIKRKKIAVIGEPALDKSFGESFAEFFTRNCGNEGAEVVGTAQGYNLSGVRSDALENEARELAKNADVVLLFIGLDKEREESFEKDERAKLNANLLSLSDKLVKDGAKVIGILTTNQSVETLFDEKLSALMLAPLDNKNANEALSEILLGISNPSGRLAFTYYNSTDGFFGKIKYNKNSGRLKIGGFLGYRYYDAAEIPVKYPFGFGLSYSSFSYSDFKITGDTVEVTVKNTGAYAGSEVVQLYIGKSNSAVLRPKKELKDFKKVFLTAGESKRIQFKINSKLLSVYDERKRKYVTEWGEYEAYIASNVSDVKFTGKITVSGEYLTRDNKKSSDYFLSSSNVLTEGYTLKNVKITAKKGKNALFAGIIGALISLLLLGITGLLDALHLFDGVFGDAPVLGLTEHKLLAVMGIALGCVFAIFAFVFAIGLIMRRSAKRGAATVAAKHTGTVSPRQPYELLFEEEFAEEVKKEEDEKLALRESFDEEAEALRYDDPTLDFRTAISQLMTYCKSCGISVDQVSAAKILASFASSRLIILKSKSSSLFPRFLEILSGYFSTVAYIEEFSDFNSIDDFLTNNVLKAVEDAAKLRQNVHIASLTNVNIQTVPAFFTPLLKYVSAPEASDSIKYGYDKTLAVPKNLWFVFALADGSKPTAEEAFILNSAAFVDVNLTPCKPSAEKASVKFFSFYRLRRLSREVAEKFPLDEDKCWKKVDKLEKFVDSRSAYHLGNKLWLRCEKFASTIRACGANMTVSLDCAVSGILLPAVALLLKDKSAAGDESLSGALENIFGEENIQECKKILIYFGISAV